MGWRQRTKIYNTATFDNPDDKLKLDEVFEKLEAYAKPQSNQILARFQLRCLKQGDMPLEEFVTKARLLIDDSGYSAEVKDETLRDTLVFGLKSDQVRRDAIKLGNTLTLKQVYDLAKVEESTRAQMEVITKGDPNHRCPCCEKQEQEVFKFQATDEATEILQGARLWTKWKAATATEVQSQVMP